MLEVFLQLHILGELRKVVDLSGVLSVTNLANPSSF